MARTGHHVIMGNCATIILAASVASASCVRAATVDWINPSGGVFQTGANWNVGVAPGMNDVAQFGLSTPIDVTLNAAVFNQRLIVRSGAHVTWHGSPFNYVANSSALPGVLIGDVASDTPARFQVASGNIGAFDIVLGNVAGSSAVVSAINGSWGASRQCIIGNDGDGTFTTSNEFVNVNHLSLGDNIGARGFMQTSAGFFGPTQLQVGRLGAGTLRITDGTDIGTGSIVIGDGASGAGTIDLVNNVEWGNSTLTIGNAGSGTFLFGSGTMTDSGGAYIARLPGSRGYFNLNDGSIVIARALNVGGADSAAGGDGTLLLSDGTLIVSAPMRIWNHGNVVWNAGTLSASSIELNGGGSMTVAVGLTTKLLKTAKILIDTANHSLVDLADNDALLSATNRAAIESLVAAARRGGDWTGGGITSSAAQSQSAHATTLGVLSGAEYKLVNGATFDGVNVADNDVLVRYTFYGDTDFNRTLNFDDYARIDSGFNNGRSGWINGDFDFNGVVNFDDYALIDLAFNSQSPASLRAIPEPCAAALLIAWCASGALRARRQRRAARASAKRF